MSVRNRQMQGHKFVPWWSLVALLLQFVADGGRADEIDWVNPLYVERRSSGMYVGDDDTAVKRILDMATESARHGPWKVTDSPVMPASGDVHDYLSWAPYWWPNCNWCQTNTPQSDSGSNADPDAGSGTNSTSSTTAGTVPSITNPLSGTAPSITNPLAGIAPSITNPLAGTAPLATNPLSGAAPAISLPLLGNVGTSNAGMGILQSIFPWLIPQPVVGPAVMPTNVLPTLHKREDRPVATRSRMVTGTMSHTTKQRRTMATHSPSPRWVARTSIQLGNQDSGGSNEEKSAKDKSGGGGGDYDSSSSCTPSRTRMAPSETWTTCPYKQRDGKANPDVRSLTNINDINSMSQSVLWNGVAYGLTNQSSYAEAATKLIYSWFLDPTTGVNPHVKYGQVVRGPDGTQEGGYIGILDWRMLVKVVNAIVIMRAGGASAWNQVLAASMNRWATNYLNWLLESEQGNRAAKANNNHATFYFVQLLSLEILLGDINSARKVANLYFTGPFMKQISASGEQPFEAVRTRPFHYRCFNLEAVITLAKMADNLGLNMWSAQSDKGATIQTATDYLLSLDPKSEDISTLAPIVDAVQSAYGDPTGQYSSFLDNDDNTGDVNRKASWWFYNNPNALLSSPSKGNTQSSQQFSS